MAVNYIPSTSAGYDGWLNNFQTVIAASPVTYGLLAADATAITNAFNAWHASYLLAGTVAPHNTPINPGTRTPVNVAAMATERASSLIVARTYAQLIGANSGVSDADKIAAGLTARATGRTPIPAPGTNPILGFLAATPLQHQLKYSDSATPTTKRKPFGAINLELWQYIGTTPPTGTADYKFIGDYTKSPLTTDFLSADIGKTAYYIAKWTTRTGLDGPWSAPLHAAIV